MIYVTTGGFSERTAAETAEDYIASGIRNIELSAGKHCADIEEQLAALTGQCNFIVHNYFPVPVEPFVLNLASLKEDVFSASYQHIHSSIGLAYRLGSKYYSFHAGFLLDPKPSELGKRLAEQDLFDYDEAVDKFVAATNALSEYAASLNIQLLVENNVCSPIAFEQLGANPFLLSDPEGVSDLFGPLNQNVRMLLDVAHLKVSANTLGYDTDVFVSECYDLIGGYHLSDNCGTVDRNNSFDAQSYFWPYVKNDLDYYSIEVYNVTNSRLIELSSMAQHKLNL